MMKTGYSLADWFWALVLVVAFAIALTRVFRGG